MNTLKHCIDCKLNKEINEFPFDKSRNRYLSVCKKCTATRTEKYRQQHKGKWKEQSKTHSAKRKSAIDEWKSQGCAKCGDKRHYVIDAHHLDPTKKDFSIGTSMRGINVTKLELEKCIPLCSNCHREFHYLDITIENYLISYGK
jgi:hypothetical protein